MDWNHIHLATNHLPVVGTIFCLIFWFFSTARKYTEGMRMVLWIVVFTCVTGIAVKFTGEPAAENVKAEQSVIQSHEDWADRATTGLFVWLLFSGWALWDSRGSRKTVRPVAWWMVTVAGVATMILLIVAAYHGGQISHPNLRPA